jgi:SAM-dependent methyltransferase
MQVLKGRCIAEMPGKILSISGSSRVCELIGTPRDRIVEAPYPEYNVLDLRFENNQFDMVCFDQVLEHVEGNPQRAIDEIQRVLKPGGVMVCATVLVYPIHGYPSDYWRFTPEGLRLLCSGFSTILDYGGWGNMYVWMLAWLGLHQELVPECRWHPLYRVAVNNDPNWKIVTWIVAQK